MGYRTCRHAVWWCGLGLVVLTGCVEVTPEVSGPTPAQRALLGMTKQALLACAGPPVVERAKEGKTLFVYYREAPQFEESFGGSKSSFSMVRHGCRAVITFEEDRVRDIRYESEPSTYRDEDHCEEIFEACVSP
ncbi:MAG TPA: hypothetical protein VFR79_10560 [Nitrospira sp.]|nr:hypothetical protein [Nitrospira sp.]